MGTVTVLSAERMLAIEANAVMATHQNVTKTMLAVPAGTAVTGTLALGKAYRLNKLVANKPCRLRLYANAAYRTADADRPRSEDPEGDHGLILEAIPTADLLELLLLPMPHGYAEGGPTYFSLFNDGSTGDITFTLTEHVLES